MVEFESLQQMARALESFDVQQNQEPKFSSRQVITALSRLPENAVQLVALDLGKACCSVSAALLNRPDFDGLENAFGYLEAAAEALKGQRLPSPTFDQLYDTAVSLALKFYSAEPVQGDRWLLCAPGKIDENRVTGLISTMYSCKPLASVDPSDISGANFSGPGSHIN